jgi:hypothetical protein
MFVAEPCSIASRSRPTVRRPQAAVNGPVTLHALGTGPGRGHRLTDQHVQRGQVPHRHLRLGGDIDGPLGHQAIRQKVSVGHPPPRIGQLDEAFAQRL